jgi:cold shock CspA family protein
VKYFIEHSKEEDLFVHFGGFTLAQATKLQRGTVLYCTVPVHVFTMVAMG